MTLGINKMIIKGYKYCKFILLVFSTVSVVSFGNRLLLGATNSDGNIQGRMYMFHSQGCHNCKYVINEILPPLYKKYPQIRIKFFELSKIENYQLLVRLEETYNDKDNTVPIIFIGEKVLSGVAEILGGLEPAIKEGIVQGGYDWPKLKEEDKQKYTVP